MLKYALLGFLNYAPTTGYDLKTAIDRSTGNFWHAKQSQIYATLKKMEADGLLASHAEAQTGRPDRRVYHLTDAGRADLEHWLSEPVTDLPRPKVTLLLKLFFSANQDKDHILTQLKMQLNLHRQALDRYRLETPLYIRGKAHKNPALERDALLWETTRRFGELHEDMFSRWLKETIDLIERDF